MGLQLSIYNYILFIFRALLLLAIGMIVMKCICAFTGLAMYAWYSNCDPLRAKVLYYILITQEYNKKQISIGIKNEFSEEFSLFLLFFIKK